MMRRILVDHARARAAAKRAHGMRALPLVDDAQLPGEVLDGVAAIHDALEALAAIDRAQSDIVELRFFGGLTHEEIADHLGVSLERLFALAVAHDREARHAILDQCSDPAVPPAPLAALNRPARVVAWSSKRAVR